MTPEKIKENREKAGLSEEELAELTGVGKQFIQRIESSTWTSARKPTKTWILLFERVLVDKDNVNK